LLLLLSIIYTINLPVVRPRSCRVIYYFDTPALGRRHQSFGRVRGVVTIVQWVKGMREMGCMTYGGEEDVEVAGHWLRKVKRVINQMQVLEELRVDCVTQLLVDSAHFWWETIRERRSGEVLRWRDFREEFEER